MNFRERNEKYVRLDSGERNIYKRILHWQVGDEGKSGPAAEHNWSDTASEEQPDSPARSRQTDHEYHEISDEEDDPVPKVSEREVMFSSFFPSNGSFATIKITTYIDYNITLRNTGSGSDRKSEGSKNHKLPFDIDE